VGRIKRGPAFLAAKKVVENFTALTNKATFPFRSHPDYDIVSNLMLPRKYGIFQNEICKFFFYTERKCCHEQGERSTKDRLVTQTIFRGCCLSGLMTRQRLVQFSHTFVKGISENHILSLSRQVAHFHKAGLVHGDLCRSNIGSRGDKVFVFDWEPAIVLGKGVLRTTPYL
jgi:hypothetical protein